MAASLAIQVPRFPGNDAWLRRFRTPEITPAWRFAQDFTMSENGLNGIAFDTAQVGPPAGQIVLRLFTIPDTGELSSVAQRAVSAAEVAVRPAFEWAFIPLENSQFERYRLEITATDNSGLALLATRGDRYPGGSLTANGTSRWADLLFRTSASVPVSSILETLWSRQSAPGRVSGKAILVLLAVNWIAMGFLFRAFLSIQR